MLVQHAFPARSPSFDAIPGRLYFDGELVPMRSQLEADVLTLLRNAEVKCLGTKQTYGERYELAPNALILGDDLRQILTSDPEVSLRSQIAAMIRFIESDKYVQFALRVEQAADLSRYTVWPAWDPAHRKHVAVRLGRVLGIGLQSADQYLDRGTPLAESISALEVFELAKRYAAEGLAMRVEPAFPWPLP